MKPRILLIHRAGWGGAEKTLLDFIEGLIRQDWPVVVAAPPGRFLERAEASKAQVEPVEFPAWRKARDYFKNRSCRRRTGGLATATKAAAVVAGDIRTVPFAVAAAEANNVPCLAMVQDGTIKERHVKAYQLHRADRVVCPSYPLLNRIRRGGIQKERSMLLPVGIDTTHFHPLSDGSRFRDEWRISEDALLLGCVGSISRLKGQDLLLEAAAPLLDEWQRVQIVFVGLGREEYINELKHGYEPLIENGRIRFAGWREDIPSVLAAFDIVVVPSRAESFSRAAAEAMALGKPVVATRTGAVEELMGNDEYGLTVEVENVISLREALKRLIRDTELRKQLGRAAFARVRDSFSLSRSVEIFESVLRGLCENR